MMTVLASNILQARLGMAKRTIKRLINTIPEIFLLVDTRGCIFAANRAALRAFNLSASQIEGHQLEEFLDTEETDLSAPLRQGARSSIPTYAKLNWQVNSKHIDLRTSLSRFEVDDADIGISLIAMHCTRTSDFSGQFSLLNRELENNKQTLIRLMESKRVMEYEHQRSMITLQSIADAVITTDRLGFIEVCNDAAAAIAGVQPEKALQMHVSELFGLIEGSYETVVQTPLEACIKSGEAVLLHEARALFHKSKSEHVISVSASPIRSIFDRIVGAVMVFRDISEVHKTRSRLKFLAEHDLLTGVANRHQFNTVLAEVLETTSEERPSTLIFFDMDLFKVVNDTAGHQAGDELLREVTRLIRSRLRSSDLFARVGGDEFTLILPDTNQEAAYGLCRQILQLVKRFIFRWDEHSFDVTLSAGLTTIAESNLSASEAIRQADVACYVAKRSGGNQLHCFAPEDTKSGTDLTEYNLISEIRRALDHNNFYLNFQPLVDLQTGELAYHEVLVRMRDSANNIVAPGKFIPVAERTGLMLDLDIWVVTHAIKCVSDYRDRGIELKLSINLSGRSVGNSALLDHIEDAIERYEIPKNSLIFEITETAAIENFDTAVEFVTNLRKLGCLISLDDFGAGFSSFRYLKKLPVEFVKIDGSFVTHILRDRSDEAMVRAIHQIAKSLGKFTVAEFIEDAEVVALLQEIGIDYGQGFHWGQPSAEPQLLPDTSIAKRTAVTTPNV